jgi:hypothetical protein
VRDGGGGTWYQMVDVDTAVVPSTVVLHHWWIAAT